MVSEAARFQELVTQLTDPALGTLPFLQWLDARFVATEVPRATLVKQSPDLCRAALRMHHTGLLARPPGVRLTEEHRSAPTADDRVLLVEDWLTRHLIRTGDPSDEAVVDAVRRALPAVGYQWTRNGIGPRHAGRAGEGSRHHRAAPDAGDGQDRRWDAPRITGLADLTAVTTITSVVQTRGWALRTDPDWPEKVAVNWSLVCVAEEHPKGGNDWDRLVRKHSGFFGLDDVGAVVDGVAHLDPRFSPFAPTGSRSAAPAGPGGATGSPLGWGRQRWPASVRPWCSHPWCSCSVPPSRWARWAPGGAR